MARRRLRHKLLLGLGLVVATVGLLLVGTLKALSSYNATMNTNNSKLDELQRVEELCHANDELVAPIPPAIAGDRQAQTDLLLKIRLPQVLNAVDLYAAQLADTLQKKRDPDQGEQPIALIGDLREAARQFQAAVQDANAARFLRSGEPSRLTEYETVRTAHHRMTQAAHELRKSIYDSLYYSIDTGRKKHYRNSLILALTTGAVGVAVVAALIWLVPRWVVRPVRKLQEGVARVAQGDFDHPIALGSGDELQELAEAFNDMTAKLQATYRDMAQQINERSRQLVRSERLVSVGFLAAGVAHEINNPLASIAFCAEALVPRITELLGRAPVEGEPVGKYLKMIQHEAFRCKEITQRLLQFSRGGDQREPTELGELVQAVLEIAQHLESCHGKRIVFQPSARLMAEVNGQEITQVILNLVVNALESMGDGGSLVINLTQRGPCAELMFSDTGSGMTAEVLENIFEPFYTTKPTGRGTGLGLSISHLIITQHGGEIAATSAGPNQGSTFTIRLPLRPTEVPAPPLPLRTLTGHEGLAWAGAAA